MALLARVQTVRGGEQLGRVTRLHLHTKHGAVEACLVRGGTLHYHTEGRCLWGGLRGQDGLQSSSQGPQEHGFRTHHLRPLIHEHNLQIEQQRVEGRELVDGSEGDHEGGGPPAGQTFATTHQSGHNTNQVLKHTPGRVVQSCHRLWCATYKNEPGFHRSLRAENGNRKGTHDDQERHNEGPKNRQDQRGACEQRDHNHREIEAKVVQLMSLETMGRVYTKQSTNKEQRK